MLLTLAIQAALAQSCGTLEAVDQQVVDEMHMILPERQVLNPGYVLDVDRNLLVTPENAGGVLNVTFLAEGAGYKNQVGWFVFDPLLVPNDATVEAAEVTVDSGVIWANASRWDAGGDGTCLQVGHTITIPLDPAWIGLKVGFWLKANGFNCPGCVTWYTLDEINAVRDNPASHVVMVQSTYDTQSLFMGFEDLWRSNAGCDNDFNDLVLRLTSTPPEIVEDFALANELPVLNGDTDGDGVPDSVDDFPDDTTKAIDNRYPSASEYFTVAFEDMFPDVGDADYNDFVGIGSYHEHLNAAGQLVELQGQIQIITRGASRDAAFHLRIDGLPAGSWTIDRRDWTEQPSGSDAGSHGGGALDLTLFPSNREALPPFNTAEGLEPERGSVARFSYVPNSPFDPSTMEQAPYDPYLLMLSTGFDIHTVGKAALPGSVNPGGYETFIDANGFPWGLVFPEPWDPPNETVHIEDAYTDFGSWRTTSGTNKKTWYRGGRQKTVVVPETHLLPKL